MVYLSALSFAASVMYFYVGYNVYKLNKKSELCKLFFAITITMMIWSFAGGFTYLAVDKYEYSLWNKISAFGWCTFEAFSLYFSMTFTGNKNKRHWYIKLIVFAPAVIFLGMVLFLFGPDINTPQVIRNIFDIGNFLYNFSYLLSSIILIAHWGIKSSSRLQKKQAHIITIYSIIPFVLNLIVQHIIPLVGLPRLPYMGQLFMLIMLWGLNNSIFRYQFMSIPTSLITNELFHELNGLAFLLDSQGFVIKSNRQVNSLMPFNRKDMIGCHITELINASDLYWLMKDCEAIHTPVKLQDLVLTTDTGKLTPFHVSVIPLRTEANLLLGFLVLGEDISATKELYEEIEKHKITNEKLGNSEKLFRTVLEITPVPIILTRKSSGFIMYMNTQAQDLFREDTSELFESNVFDYFVNNQDRDALFTSMSRGEEVNKKEATMKRKDGSELLGVLTVIPFEYQEEEVSLFCIIDITNQRKIEETLKLNNERINKLNSDLLMMNNILTDKSNKDSLTNLYNHQYINEVLEEKLHTVTKENFSLCIMMLDIDYFKQVNDRFGHQVGDQVLISICTLISKNVRNEDYIGRYGGEEFLVVLPDIELEAAVRIAEEIRIIVQNFDFGLKDLKVTVSIGVLKHNGETSNALVNKADMLLYRAKYNGRNRVEA